MAPLQLAALKQKFASVLRRRPTRQRVAGAEPAPHRRQGVFQRALLKVARGRGPRPERRNHTQDLVDLHARVGVDGERGPRVVSVAWDADGLPAADDREGYVGLGQLLGRQVLHERFHVLLAALYGSMVSVGIPARVRFEQLRSGEQDLHRSGSGGRRR